MKNFNPLFITDFYKQGHPGMFPDGTTKIYSNGTCRKSRMPGVDKVVFFGMQYFIKEYLIRRWNENFFQRPKDEVITEFTQMMTHTMGHGVISSTHVEQLHDLGYLPIKIKALPEGTLVPIRVPLFTITNTVDHAYWLVNFLETTISNTIWQSFTSATIAFEYRKLLNKYAKETAGDTSFVDWQGHDFSMRGMSSLESACLSGAAHLLSFKGTDTIPAIAFLEEYYGADVEEELVGGSVPATEHSVMCMGSKDGEIETFKTLLDKYPSGILSVVSDTWDLWKVCTEYVVTLKDQILARDGKLVIRPDSGDPVDIICGRVDYTLFHMGGTIPESYWIGTDPSKIAPSEKGVIELLWDVFGGTINEQGYKVLDPHIGVIYGDSITLERAEQICERLKAKGFASTNIVLGIGSFTYQYNTRDTFGFAMKATYGEVREDILCDCGDCENACYLPSSVGREIFKDPITDDGTKKSAKGLLQVFNNRPDGQGGDLLFDGKDHITLQDQVSWGQEEGGLLEQVFMNGSLLKDQTLSEIRERLSTQL